MHGIPESDNVIAEYGEAKPETAHRENTENAREQAMQILERQRERVQGRGWGLESRVWRAENRVEASEAAGWANRANTGSLRQS
jgi:hypothetical protein